MTLKQFISKWNGKKADWDGYYGGQCVDLFRYYCNEVLEMDRQPAGVWGAANFWSDFESDPVLVENFTKVQNTSDFTPLEGDVMIWNFNAGGGYGHVAICTGENTGTQYFKSFDQNWSRVSYSEIVNHSYKNVYGVLRPKVSSTTPPMPSNPTDGDLQKILTHYKVKDANELIGMVDKQLGFLHDARNKITEVESDLSGATARADNLEKKNQDFVDKIANMVKSIADESRIIEAIETLLSNETTWTKKVSDLEKAIVDKERKHKDEIREIKKSFQLQNDKLEEMIEQNKRLIKRVEGLETEKKVNSKLNKLIVDIINFFKKGKS